MKKPKKLTLILPVDLALGVKMELLQRDMDASELAAEALRAYLDRPAPKTAKTKGGKRS
jgi:hypothetical protein